MNNDRQNVLKISREMGFLTGYESKQMEEAHVDAVMILGEMFRCESEFDFGRQVTVVHGITLQLIFDIIVLFFRLRILLNESHI